MSVIATAVIRLFHVQRGMFPSCSTLAYASVVKPSGGSQDTGVAAADVSDLNDVTTAQRNGSSQNTASTTRATIAPMRPGLAKRSPVRSPALLASRPRGYRLTAAGSAVVACTAVLIMHSCGWSAAS